MKRLQVTPLIAQLHRHALRTVQRQPQASPPRVRWQTSRVASKAAPQHSKLRSAIDKARKDNPILFPVLLVGSLASVAVLGLMAYDEYFRVAPQYSAYPLPVEQRLRVALHHTYVAPDPDAASESFIEAIKAADQVGMDPFGKESMGIRIRYAEMLEKFGRVKAAVEVLSNITSDCEGKLDQLPLTSEKGDDVVSRTSLLRAIIQIKVKTAALYESDYLQDLRSAKLVLSDAVGLLVKETKDPQSNGFNEDNAAGLTMPETASILSQMGDLYATSGEEANAVQVYMLTLQPLRAACNGTRSCKEVQVLSNIASTMDLALKKPNAKISGRPATEQGRTAARRAILKWADQAIATAEVVTPQDRDEICELGLLSAKMTRADLLLDTGEKDKSRELFTSLLPLLRQKGLTNLTSVAEQGVQRAST